MTRITPEFLDTLERGLEGVTPGPYDACEERASAPDTPTYFLRKSSPDAPYDGDTVLIANSWEDALHFQRLDPDTIRALIAALREAWKEKEKAEWLVRNLPSIQAEDNAHLRDENRLLRDALTAACEIALFLRRCSTVNDEMGRVVEGQVEATKRLARLLGKTRAALREQSEIEASEKASSHGA